MSGTTPHRGTNRTPGGSRPAPNLILLEARIRAGLSREDLSRLTGLSRKQIAFIERGKSKNPHVSSKTRIATAVRADVLDLFPLR